MRGRSGRRGLDLPAPKSIAPPVEPEKGRNERLTRRVFLLRSAMVLGFGAVLAKLGIMQLRERPRYQRAAQGSMVRFEPLRAPRGLILDRNGQVLARNRRSWTVWLVPAELPEDERERQLVREQLVRALGLDDLLVVHRPALPTGHEREVLDQLAAALGVPGADLAGRVFAAPPDRAYVVVREKLAPEEAAHLRETAKRLPGVHVLNRFDYVALSAAGSAVPVALAEDVPRDLALTLAANPTTLPGVRVTDDTLVREYPAGREFSHVLGYVGPITREEYEAAGGDSPANPYRPDDRVGRGGVEQAMEEALRGHHGGRWVQVDARNVVVGELLERRRDPVPGLTVVLTLDATLQRAVTVALAEGIQAADRAAREQGREPVGSGVAIVLDPRSGEVLALVSLPTYDNQQFVRGLSRAEYQALLDDPFHPLVNFAISGEFPPGSTVKPLLACAGLQEGVITEETTYTCRGAIRVPTVWDERGGNTYVCWLASGHGEIGVLDGIAQSCNVFFYNVGAPGQVPEGGTEPLHYYISGDPEKHYFAGLGIERIERYLRDVFGFGQPTGIELAGEADGLVPNPRWMFQTLREYWSVGDTINVSIGQGHLACTPLQLACALAAIANRGVYYRPRIVKELRDESGQVVRRFEPEVVRRLAIAPEHLETVRRGMRRTVTDGTAKGKFVRTGEDIPIAGKTGTAEYGEAENGRYKKSHAWFAAFAPYDDPEVLVLVLIRDGGEGATFAVPVADRILATYFGRAA
ncbi:MAG: penicillin-binding protein 2 [Thermomicrobium sp.]|nr:penicillin-binding protein 2 [Thermomicrobium sp.]MDW8059567.1 penicillin-binding protein 2 [Thermomicrobium sp.]